MNWHLSAQVGHEVRRYLLDQDAQALEEVSREPLPARGATGETLGHCNNLQIAISGPRAPWDLEITQDGRSLQLTGACVTSRVFAHLPELDAMALVTGDAGDTTSRRLSLFALQPLRQALSEGQTSLNASELDQCTVHGATNGIEVERPELRIWSLDGLQELVCTWNVPGAQPASAHLKVIQLPDWSPNARLAAQRTAVSPTVHLDRFWLTHLFNQRTQSGTLKVVLAGVGRQRRNFCLATRVLETDDDSTSLYQATREQIWSQHQLEALQLRDASGIKAATLLPGGQEMVLAVETPMRQRRLLQLRWSGNHLRVDPLEGPSNASKFWIEQEETPEPQEGPQEEPRPKPATAPLIPAETTPNAPTPPPEANPGALQRVEGEATVNPGGVAIDLGTWDTNAQLAVQASVVGDGRWVRLLWWLSHEDNGQERTYTLHLEAAREVQVHYRASQWRQEAP